MRSFDGLLPFPLEIHPGLHARVAFLQKRPVSVVAPGIPGNDDARIRPGAGTRFADHVPLDARHHIRHAPAESRLLGTQIPEILPVEGRHIECLAGGLRDGLCVSGPAQPLVPLRAVCRYFQEVVLHAPERILEEPVDRLAAGLKPCRLRHGAAQMHCRKVLRPDGTVADKLHIPESEEAEVGPHLALRPVREIGKGGNRGAVVFVVEFPVLEDFAGGQRESAPLRKPGCKLYPAGQVLPEVQDRIAPGRADQFSDREAVHFLHREIDAVLQRTTAGRCSRFGRSEKLRREPRIPGFTVIDVRKGDRRAQFFPALIRNGQQAVSLPELGNGIQAVAVQVGIAAVEPEPAFKPAFAQGNDKLVFSPVKKPGHVVGLHPEMKIIGMIAGGQIFVPDLLSVQIRLIKAEAAEIEPGRLTGFFCAEAFAKQRAVFLCFRADPLC